MLAPCPNPKIEVPNPEDPNPELAILDPKRLLEVLELAVNPLPVKRLGKVVSIFGASLLAVDPNRPLLLAEKIPTFPNKPTPFPFWKRLEKRGLGLSFFSSEF